MIAAMALHKFQKLDSVAQAKKNIVQAMENIAKKLGNTLVNTPTICRKCYVHPAVIESYLEGSMLTVLQKKGSKI